MPTPEPSRSCSPPLSSSRLVRHSPSLETNRRLLLFIAPEVSSGAARFGGRALAPTVGRR